MLRVILLPAVLGIVALGCSGTGSPAGAAAGSGSGSSVSGGDAGGAGATAVGAGGAGGLADMSTGGSAISVGGSLGGSGAGGAAGGGSAGTASSSLDQCELAFPYQDEPDLGTWLGGDSAYSVQLAPGKALWSFQDTFVGAHGMKVRKGAGMIANSYAWVKCEAGVYSIQYFWRKDGDAPAAVLADGTPNQRFWPQQPILYQGVLFQAATRVNGGAMEAGTSLARVENPLDPPNQWRVSYFDLAPIPGLGKGTVVVDDYAYLFSAQGNQAIATRLPLKELIKPDTVPTQLLEYLGTDGAWHQGFDAASLKKLGFSATVGTSFRYLAGPKKWLVLFYNTAGWPSNDISISTAPALEGPWSKPQNVYRVPEMVSGSPVYDSDNVCYAAISHDESNPSPDTQLLFSYTCNSLVFDKQVANLDIYLPKIVKLDNPVK